ncbi:hypothetical protein [Halosimplex pelagicum]|uniref:Uncharacterized protein n=1 Tax=Halosimplex pelagicum TaxID=869886 RepID=A0A7D5P9H7_9EURY|nr:hypothetical protein [Halosimplex pelagicum]QLH80478.1 hypothetical protein HZS54_02010 [Halosimplex pelagicum]
MSDRYEIYFAFESPWSSSDLQGLVERLSGREQLTHPVDSQTTTESDQTPHSDPTDRYVSELASDSGYIGISLGAPGLACSLIYTDSENGPLDLPQLNISVQDHHFFPQEGETDQDAIERIDTLYTFLADLYEVLVALDRAPVYVYGLQPIEYDKATNPDHVNGITAEQLRSGEILGIYWCQIFPPRLVEQLGAEQLLSVPAFRSEQLSDGGILLVVTHAMNTQALPPEDHAPNVVSEKLGIDWEL